MKSPFYAVRRIASVIAIALLSAVLLLAVGMAKPYLSNDHDEPVLLITAFACDGTKVSDGKVPCVSTVENIGRTSVHDGKLFITYTLSNHRVGEDTGPLDVRSLAPGQSSTVEHSLRLDDSEIRAEFSVAGSDRRYAINREIQRP